MQWLSGGGVEVLGTAPSQMLSFRAQAAAATGIAQADRCAATAIAIGFGIDPAEHILKRQLVIFFRYVRKQAIAMAAVPGRFRVAWTAAKEKYVPQGQLGGGVSLDTLAPSLHSSLSMAGNYRV